MPPSDREPNRRDLAPWQARPRAGHIVALLFGSVPALLIARELLQPHPLAGGEERLEAYRHLVGWLVALLAALISAFLLLKGSPSLFSAAAERVDHAFGDEEVAASPTQRDAHFAEWFILMRWLAVLVAMLVVFVSVAVMEYLPEALWPPLAACLGALVLLNIVYTYLLRAGAAPAPLLKAQAYGDLVILTALLHFSGGIENPLTTLMVLHVIIAGIILERRQCYYVAMAATLLFAGLAYGEYSGLLTHYTLSLTPHAAVNDAAQFGAFDARYVLGRLALHAAIVFLAAHFATSIMGALRRGEREQRRIELRARQAEKLATIGELAGRVAHEVNNPVAIISAKTRLLLSDHRTELTSHTASELGKIVDLSDRIASITQGLLAYCRPSTRRTEQQSLRPAIRKALAIIEPSARAAGVDVREQVPDALAEVVVNEGEMEQVFLNLYLNALDAMPAGGVLSVTGYEEGSGTPASSVCVVVGDTGGGIAPEIRARMFEPFLTTKPVGKGTGLGLSICLGLVTSNGGTIEVDSSARGTRMLVRLPTARIVRKPASATPALVGVA